MTGNERRPIESQISPWCNSLPRSTRLLVEGGHFTIRWKPLDPSPGPLLHEPDVHYLLHLRDDSALLPFEIARGPLAETRPVLAALVSLRPGERLDLKDYPQVTEAYALECLPSLTELRSLILALEAGVSARKRVEEVSAALFLGDLSIPAFVRPYLAGTLLPSLYREELERCEFAGQVQVFFESVCRNRGKERLLDSYHSQLESPERMDAHYRKTGSGIFEEPAGEAIYYLAADRLLERERFPLIALTKKRKIPTCALIMAGRLTLMAKQGFTHLLSLYDMADDAQIESKNFEGMVIASCLGRDFNLEATFMTIRRDRASRVPMTSGHYQKAGECGRFSELVALARHQMQAQLDIVEQCASTHCFPPKLILEPASRRR